MNIFDGHSDIWTDLIIKTEKGESDILRKYHLNKLREGQITGSIFAIWIDPPYTDDPYKRTIQIFDSIKNEMEYCRDSVLLAKSYGDIERALKDEIKKRVNEMLDLVQLKGYENRKPDALSGGQKQRVAIARALINNPKVLLLDEPLGALDLKLRKQMQVELKRLQKKLGITFVYVTHDQEEALTMSDRIAVMNEGVIEQLGTPREIYDRPLTKFVAGFIGESNIFDGKVISVNDGIIYVETSAGTMKVKGNGFEAGEDIHVSIRPEHIKVSADSVEGFNLRGKIKDNIYMGTFVKTSVDLKDKTEIKYSRIEKEEEFTEGNFVNIYWNPERAVAIKSKS
jgi:spermidine/putrescine transport system ATP-binding protein